MRPKAFLVFLTFTFTQIGAASLLCLIYAPAASAATPPVVGKMSATGMVTINGVRMPAEVTLFGGDRIATERDATATLTFTFTQPGAASSAGSGRLILPALSTAQLRLQSNQLVIALEQGAVAVVNRPADPMVIDAGGVRIEGVGGAASAFEVALNGKQLRVLAHRGTALVRNAERTLEVKEGMLLDATLTFTEIDAASSAPEPQGPSGAGSLTGFQTLAVVVAVTAGVTGLVFGIAAFTRSNPEDCRAVSPSFTVVCD